MNLSSKDIVITKIQCNLYRFVGFLLLLASLINLCIMIRYFIHRYYNRRKRFLINRLLEQRCDLNVLCCALLAFCWAFPPLFGLGNRFVREGAGFYCSLDWNNSSIQSRIFLISLIFFNYVIPFILLVYSNLCVYCILRYLLKSRENLFLRKAFSPPLKSCYITDEISLEVDRRYALMTAVISVQYLVAWTPYALIELLNLTGRNTLIQRNPFLPTFCALLAKLSLILNPIILIYTSKMTKE